MKNEYLSRERLPDNEICSNLFSAKTVDGSEWVMGYLSRPCCCSDEGEIKSYYFEAITVNKTIIQCVVDAHTVCRCSGLKDKNGKLIWQHDLLDGYIYPFMKDGEHISFAEVVLCYDPPAFCIEVHKHIKHMYSKVDGPIIGYTELMEKWNPINWEIIGNIFDNSKEFDLVSELEWIAQLQSV